MCCKFLCVYMVIAVHPFSSLCVYAQQIGPSAILFCFHLLYICFCFVSMCLCKYFFIFRVAVSHSIVVICFLFLLQKGIWQTTFAKLCQLSDVLFVSINLGYFETYLFRYTIQTFVSVFVFRQKFNISSFDY